MNFVDGVGTANMTLYDAQSTTLNVTDVPSTVAGSDLTFGRTRNIANPCRRPKDLNTGRGEPI